MVSIALVYQGSLRCLAEHGPSKATLISDAPTDNHGKGESFSPTDLVATALGVCMATVMGIVAQREHLALEGARAQVDKHMVTAPQRRIARITVAFTLPAALTIAQRALLERAAHTCPVALSLHPDVVQDIRFAYA